MPRGHRRTRTETIFNGIVPPPPIDTTGQEVRARRGEHRTHSELSPDASDTEEAPLQKKHRGINYSTQEDVDDSRAAGGAHIGDFQNRVEEATANMSALSAGSSVTFAPELVSAIPRLPKLPRSESMQSSSSTGSVTGPFGTASSINRPGTPFATDEIPPPPPSSPELMDESPHNEQTQFFLQAQEKDSGQDDIHPLGDSRE